MRRWPWWEIFLFVAFLFWSVAGLIFTVQHITPNDVAHWELSPWLTGFVQGCIGNGDPILIVLAFASTHAQAARQWTAARARRWGLIILVSSLMIETVGVKTGLIFGVYHYTDAFGPMLGLVPLTIPLAWYVVVTNSLFVVPLVKNDYPQTVEALFAAMLCTLYDFVLEPFATQSRHYWVWDGGVIPVKNYVAWFFLSAMLIRLFAPSVAARNRWDFRPCAILGMTLLIFLAGR